MSQANRELFQQAAALIKAGKKVEATKMLVPLLKSEPENASGWWLMANAVSDPEHKKRALRRFLQIRPGDEKGEAMLAKLEMPIEDDPFNDLDNPFAAAVKPTSTQTSFPSSTPKRRKSLLNTIEGNDNPFDDAVDNDNPFNDSGTNSAASWMSSTKSQSLSKSNRSTETVPHGSNSNSLIILGGVILAALIAVGAAVLIVMTRDPIESNSSASLRGGSDSNAYVSPEVDCYDNSSEYNQNVDEGALLPARLIDLGAIAIGETVEAEFLNGTEEHGYTFNGESGQRLVIEMWATEFDEENQLDPVIEVYDPSGEQFAFCDDREEGDWDAYMEVRLPQNGLYTIVAKRYEFNEVRGTYRLSLEQR
jgi:hypothetical protein